VTSGRGLTERKRCYKREMKQSTAKQKRPQITPAQLFKKPTLTARRGDKKALVVTGGGSVYLNEPTPPHRPWLNPVDSAALADRVQALRLAEDEVPAPKVIAEDAEAVRKRKRAEYEKKRPKRHQLTLYPPLNPLGNPASEFAADYPGKTLPFGRKGKPKRWSTAKGKRKQAAAKPLWKVVVRRRHPILPEPHPESTDGQDSNLNDSQVAD
jgi:hypothetical protein